jgi:hypothetical protein
MSMTYSELVTAIETYTENTFPDTTLADGTVVTSTTQINRFIEQAEQRIFNTIQFPSLRKNVYGVVSTTTPYLAAPSDFLSVYSIAVVDSTGSYLYLLNKDVNYIREAYPDPTSTGLPKFYAIFGPTVTGSTITNELSFILGPKPDSNYQTELHYYYYPDSITVSSDGHSWLGDNYDTVLLYGSLMEAYTYMKGEPDLIALYTQRYKEALMEAKRLGDGLERQDAYRSGQYRQAVT